MPLTLLVVLATAHLENADFVAAAMRNNRRSDLGAVNQRCADLDVVAFGNHKHLIQHDFAANVRGDLFYFKFFAGDDTILLAAGFYDRIHGELQTSRLEEARNYKEINRQGQTVLDMPVSASLPFTSFCDFLTMQAIQAFLAEDMRCVDAVIRARLHSEVILVSQVSEYIINSGGKRLRPALVLLSAGAFGYRGSHHHELAAVIEFIHTATLLHDDVVDESAQRRGRETANALFGNAASVLVGDFLYSRAFQMMVTVNSVRVMEVLSEATNVIAEGEVLQLMNCNDADISEDDYLRVIRYKTAKLFEAAARLGAIIGGADPIAEGALAAYGMHLGTAFQLIDDVLDYSGNFDETGKNIGDDLAEGKPTLPLLYLIQHGTPEQARLARRAIEEGGLAEFQAILAAIAGSGALDYTRRQAMQEAEIACAAISGLADSQYKSSLLKLAEFAVTRAY